MSAVGNLFGVDVIESPLVPPGVAYVVDRSALESFSDGPLFWSSLYTEPASSVSGYIQRKANALRADLGLELVDYRAEALARVDANRFRRRLAIMAEARLSLNVLTPTWQVTGL